MNCLLWLLVPVALMCGANPDAATIRVDHESLVRDAPALVRIDPDSVDVVVREFFTDSAGPGASETVRLPGDPSGWMIVVEYFPNSKVMRDDTVGTTQARGEVVWTPDFAGIVSMKATRGDAVITRSVSVKYPSVPAGAVLVFFVAGTILLGGAGWSLVRLFEHKPPDDQEEGSDEPGA